MALAKKRPSMKAAMQEHAKSNVVQFQTKLAKHKERVAEMRKVASWLSWFHGDTVMDEPFEPTVCFEPDPEGIPKDIWVFSPNDDSTEYKSWYMQEQGLLVFFIGERLFQMDVSEYDLTRGNDIVYLEMN